MIPRVIVAVALVAKKLFIHSFVICKFLSTVSFFFLLLYRPEIQKTSYIRMSVSSETDITIKEDIKEEQTLQMESGPLGNVR